jgi:hypothetical protein
MEEKKKEKGKRKNGRKNNGEKKNVFGNLQAKALPIMMQTP